MYLRRLVKHLLTVRGGGGNIWPRKVFSNSNLSVISSPLMRDVPFKNGSSAFVFLHDEMARRRLCIQNVTLCMLYANYQSRQGSLNNGHMHNDDVCRSRSKRQ